MSTYLSYRRRYSAPEKPEPRFQWRLRVHSLMMDDNDDTSALSDRQVQSYDDPRRETTGGNVETRSENRQTEEFIDIANSTETHRNRRGRFTRTKSEGHLKLRVRFSQVSDTSKSFDGEDDPTMYSEPGDRKFRSSQESGIDSFGEHPTDEEEDRSEKSQNHPMLQADDNTDDDDDDDGCVCEEALESAVDDGAAGQSENVDSHKGGNCGKDVSKGAIPKRFSNINDSTLAISIQPKEDEDKESSLTRDGCGPTREEEHIPGNRENSSDINKETEKSENITLNVESQRYAVPSTPFIDDVPSTPFVDDVPSTPFVDDEPLRSKGAEYDQRYTDEMPEESTINENEQQPIEDNENVDDIEAIIERLIAEEEAMLVGKENSSSARRVSAENLNDGDVKTMKSVMKKMMDDIDNDNDNDKNGISISRSTSHDNHRSSSLPSYQCDEDRVLTKTVIPFSSSCPSSNKETASEQQDKEVDLDDDGWAYLPVILLEDVFTLLTPKERHQASLVCRQWYDLFYSPRVWETFILLERTLTKKRFNLYKGYQRELCPGKTQLCFRRVGSFFKRIVVTPITDYFNLYEFLRILAAFLQYQDEHGLAAMPLLHTFDFTFACASRGDGEVIVHGTGGQILEMIKQLLIRISNLKHLKLNQLLVDEMDVPGLFDAMANCFSECLNSLEMLNLTKVPLGLTDFARFRNLSKLTASPQHLNEEVLLLLAGLNLLQLYLVQDPYTCVCEPVSYEAWKLVREMSPGLRVYLEVSGNTRAQLLIQPRAPVYGVFLRTPYSRLTNELVMSLVEHYSKTLRYFVQERLPRSHGPRGIDVRCDSSLLSLVRSCPVLHSLVIRERISTSTLILLASEGKNLSTLVVRRQGLIKRCDWPQPGTWTLEFYSRLKQCSLDYDKCTDEVCTLLRRRWRPLTDKQFMRLKIIPRVEMI